MSRTWTMLLAAAVMAALPPAAQADTAEVLTRITQKASGALAMVNCKIEGQIAGQEGTIRGVGICVNASGGLLSSATGLHRHHLPLYAPPSGLWPLLQFQRFGESRLTLHKLGGQRPGGLLLGLKAANQE